MSRDMIICRVQFAHDMFSKRLRFLKCAIIFTNRIIINEGSIVENEFRAVLVVDNDKSVCEVICKTLKEILLEAVIFGCCCPLGCPRLASRLYFDVAVCDIDMPGLYGDKLINMLRSMPASR